MALSLDDFRAAQARIRPYVRRTPMLAAAPSLQSILPSGRLVLKLECLQVTGSFKPRGAVNTLLSLPPDAVKRGIITASGGNHGLAVAYAGWIAKAPATIYLPTNAPPLKAEKARRWGAKVVAHGSVWDEANHEALKVAERDGLAYIHPFMQESVIAGQGTVALEILEDLPNVDVLLIAIGGGGLVAGMAAVAKAIKPSVRVVGIEATGAPKLYESLKAGKLVTLAKIETRVSTMAAKRSEQINLDLVRRHVDEIVLVSDDEMVEASRWLWFETGVAAEMSGAASLAALLTGKVDLPREATVCALICGVGTDGI
jgi:threonine dehydratase